MNTRDLRDLKARRPLKRALRRWARVRRILAGNQPGKPRGCVQAAEERARMNRAVLRAVRAWEDWMVGEGEWDGPTVEVAP